MAKRYVEPEYRRDTAYISDRITRDAADGWPVQPGRYRLVAARACPWASRAIIVRRLLGLEDAISLGLCGPTHDERSWTFDLDPGGVEMCIRDSPRQQSPDLQDLDVGGESLQFLLGFGEGRGVGLLLGELDQHVQVVHADAQLLSLIHI